MKNGLNKTRQMKNTNDYFVSSQKFTICLTFFTKNKLSFIFGLPSDIFKVPGTLFTNTACCHVLKRKILAVNKNWFLGENFNYT